MVDHTPWSLYQHDLAENGFQHDEAQEQAVKHLQRLFDELVAFEKEHTTSLRSPIRALKKIFTKEEATHNIQGLYFWGGVGRGKTYLVDTFYNALPFENKWRVHFHRFMYRVHQELEKLKGQSDPLDKIAAAFAKEVRVICFDEFFVQDIADAMILATLLKGLFKRGVVLVATSNIVPDELYRNGLQRARFVPAIELINQHCEVVNVDSGVDYRLRTLEKAEIYHSPLDEDADKNLVRYFHELAPDHQAHAENTHIVINGRNIQARMESDDVVLFSFKDICETARSQNDYIEIARIYHAVLISDVKIMNADTDDTARRFIALVDEFYERKVKLIMSGETDLEHIYAGGKLTFEFKRCLSRLLEMQSREYLGYAHKA
ncbi:MULTISPECIES: cell division protein ZapE [Gammaproteobacteria]|uniref:cell division protein ZapE n=1 Tax=Gammaproteobacteria TaxID=1236 RepID=UPI000DD08011|nr:MULTISPECIES: cell division protein ZapE [Gammaproteobacteria]RTE86337.1 cell division protein ZapE [Aliidiomarina sp. B3213]TCZ91687.1 cell division protein ZapE [Lysobacter sp. N42]